MTAATSSVGTVALAPELGSGDNVSGDLAGLLQIRLHAGGDPTCAGGRPVEPRTDLKQRSLLVRFGRQSVEQLVADYLDRGLTYTEIAKKYEVALSTVGKYIQQAKRQKAEVAV